MRGCGTSEQGVAGELCRSWRVCYCAFPAVCHFRELEGMNVTDQGLAHLGVLTNLRSPISTAWRCMVQPRSTTCGARPAGAYFSP